MMHTCYPQRGVITLQIDGVGSVIFDNIKEVYLSGEKTCVYSIGEFTETVLLGSNNASSVQLETPNCKAKIIIESCKQSLFLLHKNIRSVLSTCKCERCHY